MDSELPNPYELIPRDDQHMLEVAMNYVESIKDITVGNDKEEAIAAQIVGDLKKDVKTLTGRRKELTAPFKEKAVAIESRYKEVLDALGNRITAISKHVTDYHAEKERKREEKQAIGQAEAEDAARQAQEKAEEWTQKAEEYEAAGKDKLAKQARARAASYMEKAVTKVAPVEEESTPEGTSFVKKWVAEIVDLDAAVKDMLANPLLRGLVTIDLAGLARLYTNVKGNLTVDGIRFTKQTTMRNR